MSNKPREQWKSQTGFMLAAIGSAVGLGNIWRFSYIAYKNGGGAFLIPYLIALLTAGIPLLILEIGIGHERIGSAPLAYHKIKPKWEWLGWWAVIFVMFGIELYYTAIISWCANYFVMSFNLAWGEDPNSFFFKEFLQLSTGPAEVGSLRLPVVVGLAVVWLTNWAIVYRGVQKGIEKASVIFMPLLLVLTLVLVWWSVTLPGAVEGIKAYTTPDFTRIKDLEVWRDAYSQIFFTLSLGFGIMIAYASYLPEKANITRNALVTGFSNSGYELLAGFAVFSVLGFMASVEGKPISEVVTQSIGLAFVAYPKALGMIPGGNILGAVFFLCLFIAGMTSSISIIEAFTSAYVDKFGVGRERLVSIVCGAGFAGSLLFATRGGLFWLDIVDHFITHYGLVVVGMAECLIVAWIFKTSVLREHINVISSVKLGPGWEGLIKFFLPGLLVFMVAGDLYLEFKAPYEGYSWSAIVFIGVSWIVLTLVAAVIIALRPWVTENHLAPGRSDT
jgi:NSS family neurotransmitter:Na+ symporter